MATTSISESISYLLAHICKAHRGYANELLHQIGLHVGQEMILLQLWQEDGLPQSQLAHQLRVQLPTVTKMLGRMEKAGLVKRQVDGQDCRISRVYLTDQGKAIQQPVEEIWNRLEQCLSATLSLDEQRLLRRLLAQVYDNLKQ